MTTIIDAPQLRAAMVEAIAEKGEDYVYPDYRAGCYYWPVPTGTRVACLIGVALHKLGVPVETLRELNELGAIGDPKVEDEMRRAGFELSPLALAGAGRAQRLQDTGYPWDHALAGFDDETTKGTVLS